MLTHSVELVLNLLSFYLLNVLFSLSPADELVNGRTVSLQTGSKPIKLHRWPKKTSFWYDKFWPKVSRYPKTVNHFEILGESNRPQAVMVIVT